MDGRLPQRDGRPFVVPDTMKKFSFNLEIVKRLRADAEQQAQAELGRRIAVHGAAERARALRLRSLELAREQLLAEDLVAHQLAQADRERDAATLRLGAAQAEINNARRDVDSQRLHLAEASRALEILERLEQQRRDAHRTAALAEDEAIVQEIAEARTARRMVQERRAR
jgi:flagellar biosynthesis chaperone FliJ